MPSTRKRKFQEHKETHQVSYLPNSNQINGPVRAAACHTTPRQINGDIRSKEDLQRQQQYQTLLDLYGDNYCSCDNEHCKAHLNSKMRVFLQTEKLTKPLLRELTQVIAGVKKIPSAKLFRYLMKFLEDQSLDKDLFDDLLQLFLVLFLKSEEAVKVTMLQDLDNVFIFLKQAETKIFVDRRFNYKVFFYGISQLKHCQEKF